MAKPALSVVIGILFAVISTIKAEQPLPSVGLTVRGTPEFELRKGEQGEYTAYTFKSESHIIVIRVERERIGIPNSVSASWSNVLLKSSSVALRLATPKAVLSEADAKGGLLYPETTLTCVITPANRNSVSNLYRLQCVDADEKRRWLKNGQMVFEISLAVDAKRGSSIDDLLLATVGEPLSVWIE